MPRKVSTESIRRLTVELPESEYLALEEYCVQRQETKRQVIRSFIRRLISRQSNK
ncbi:MAG: CopG family transcriptional regulator [Symploca sp. SIO2B6]|nr:CopG family transcriptional regulator [Symploca sp. SIO2B6]